MIVTIKGKEYALGDIAFSDENIAFFETLMGGDTQSIPFREIRRILKDSLISGCGPEKAEEAMGGLTMNFKDGGDLKNAFEALGKLLSGE